MNRINDAFADGAAGADGADSPVIDIHVHALPAALLAGIARRQIGGWSAVRAGGGWRVGIPGHEAPRLVPAPMSDPGLRADWAAGQGLTRQVVSPWLDAQPTAAMPADAARDWARRLNAALAEQERAYGNGTLATVAITGREADDLRRAVEDDGMSGLILSTNPPGADDLADPVLEGLWEAAAGLEVPVVLHPPTGGPARALPGAAEFANAYCRLVDTTFAVTKLLLSGVLDRHPRLRIVVVHGGGFLPYQSMRLDGSHRADTLSGYRIARDRPSDYLGDMFFDTVALRAEAVRYLAQTAGAGQVLLGSDYPFPLGDRDPAGTVRSAGLGAADTAAVLGGNASRLFPAHARSDHA